MCRSRTAIRLCDRGTRTKTKDSKNRGNKDAFLALFFCSACVASINSQSLRRRRRPFPSASGSTMDFSERESSPELSSSMKAQLNLLLRYLVQSVKRNHRLSSWLTARTVCQSQRGSSPSISHLLAEILCLSRRVSDWKVTYPPVQLTLAIRVQAPKVARQIKQKVLLARGTLLTPHTAYGRSSRY